MLLLGDSEGDLLPLGDSDVDAVLDRDCDGRILNVLDFDAVLEAEWERDDVTDLELEMLRDMDRDDVSDRDDERLVLDVRDDDREGDDVGDGVRVDDSDTDDVGDGVGVADGLTQLVASFVKSSSMSPSL